MGGERESFAPAPYRRSLSSYGKSTSPPIMLATVLTLEVPISGDQLLLLTLSYESVASVRAREAARGGVSITMANSKTSH